MPTEMTIAMSVNSLIHSPTVSDLATAATKAVVIDRTHYSGPSSGGYGHQLHHHGGHIYSHGSGAHSSHGSHGGKHSIALTALTLLSFLFFLHILQNCLQEHMDQSMPPVVVMQARIQAAREAEAQKRKGETEIQIAANESIPTVPSKESRVTPEGPKQKYAQHHNKFSHVPIKLKTVDRYKYP